MKRTNIISHHICVPKDVFFWNPPDSSSKSSSFQVKDAPMSSISGSISKYECQNEWEANIYFLSQFCASWDVWYFSWGGGSTLPRCLATSYDIKLPERNKLWLPENSQTCTVTFLNMSLRDMRNRENDKTIKVWPPTTWTSQKPSWTKMIFLPKKPLRKTANVVLIFFSELLMYELQSHRGIFPNFRAQLQRILRWGPGQEQFPRNTGDFGVSFQGTGTPNAWGGFKDAIYIYIYITHISFVYIYINTNGDTLVEIMLPYSAPWLFFVNANSLGSSWDT